MKRIFLYTKPNGWAYDLRAFDTKTAPSFAAMSGPTGNVQDITDLVSKLASDLDVDRARAAGLGIAIPVEPKKRPNIGDPDFEWIFGMVISPDPESEEIFEYGGIGSNKRAMLKGANDPCFWELPCGVINSFWPRARVIRWPDGYEEI